MAQEKNWFDLLETPQGREILAESLKPRDAAQEALTQKTAAIEICEFLLTSPKYSEKARQWAKEERNRLLKLIGKRE